MKKLLILIMFVLPLSSFLTACSNEENKVNKKANTMDIYTTVYPLQYFAERIGGKYVQVHSIYPPGADEHTFEPSQRDMMDLADGDLFFYIGLGLEGFVTKSADSLKNEKVELVAAGEKLDIPEINAPHEDSEADTHEDHEEGADEHDEHGDVDPHVWLDPVYSIQLADAIKVSLIKKMPQHETDFEKNFESLKKELEKLDQGFEETIKNADHKKIIVTHAAFGYWEKRYGLEQISISGLSSSNEPSQKELKNIIKVANKEEIKYILFEQNITSKLGEIVEKEIGAKPLQLHNLSTLTEDNMKDKENYFTLMNKNLATLKTALSK